MVRFIAKFVLFAVLFTVLDLAGSCQRAEAAGPVTVEVVAPAAGHGCVHFLRTSTGEVVLERRGSSEHGTAEILIGEDTGIAGHVCPRPDGSTVHDQSGRIRLVISGGKLYVPRGH